MGCAFSLVLEPRMGSRLDSIDVLVGQRRMGLRFEGPRGLSRVGREES